MSRVFNWDQLTLQHTIMSVHMENYPKELQCTFCRRVFSRRGNLRTHMINMHSAENWKKISCQWCDAKLSSHGALKKHMKIHSNANSFKCQICDHAFTQRGNLEKHMTTHTGAKEFPCPDCPATFARKAHLQGHEIQHNRNEKHACPFCTATFPGTKGAKEHLMSTHLTVTEPQCKICFDNVKIVRGIIATGNHSDNTINCESCENSYCNEVYLAIHRTKHNLEKGNLTLAVSPPCDLHMWQALS